MSLWPTTSPSNASTTIPWVMYLPENTGAFARWRKDLIMRFIGRKYGRSKASMLQSLERGRKTEVDYLNGYIVQKAKEAKRPACRPLLHETLVRLIHEIEDGDRKSTPKNISDLDVRTS